MKMLFGDTFEGFAQQFSAVHQQTEAIQHILPRHDAPSTATPGARPQSAHRRGRPPACSRAAPPQAESTRRPAHRASRRRAWRLWGLLFLRRRHKQCRSFPRWRARRRILCFDLSLLRRCPRTSGTHFLKERAISYSSGFTGPWDNSVRRPASSLSPTTHFASSQESTVRGQHCGSYINRLGGIRSHRMSQLARHLLLWSHTQFKSLCAVHIPGNLNRAADVLSRQFTFPGVWRLHPEMIRLIWSRFGEAQVDLFASHESSHCLGPYASMRFPSEPTRTDTVQAQGGRGAGPAGCATLAPRTWFPKLISLTTAPPWHIPLRKDLLSKGLGTIWHPRPDLGNLHVCLLDGTRQT